MLPLFLVLLVSFSLGVPVMKEDREKRGFPGFQKFEGDIMLPVEQILAAEHGLDPTNLGGARGLKRSAQWPGGIVPYTIHSSAKNKFLNALGIKGPTERAINSAMKEWEEKTCIRFVPRTTQKDYVEFFAGDGCWSYVGDLKNGKQQISIGSLCYFHGIVVHEIGHALGFWHEQSRPDRDDYVEIVWDNIQEENKHNFNKYGHGSIDSLGVPYDYGSIMHYGKRDFAKWPWQTTIRAKNGASIGQRSHLSVLDVKQMNLYYKCNSKK
ncbi:hypothetical protein ACROYT_G007107 [Oculina patagonica]